MKVGAMTIEWDRYEPCDLGFAGRLAKLAPPETRQAFQRCLETNPGQGEYADL